MEEGLGAGFWFKIVGLVLACGIGAMLFYLLVGAAWVRWGGLGALLFFSVILLTYAYIYDRRQAKRYEDAEV